MKAVLISFDFSDRGNLYHRIRCNQLATLGRVIRDNFAVLQRTGHPKWQEVDLDQEIGIWKHDSCLQAVRRAPQQNDALLKAVTDILKGKKPSR